MSTEMHVARQIVQTALARDYLLNVHDGEAMVFATPQGDADKICEALCSTDMDGLIIYNYTSKGLKRVGSILLVWGNAADGSDLVADYVDKPEIRAIVDAVC